VDIRFRTGKDAIVRFLPREKTAATIMVDVLAEYGKYMKDPDIDALSDSLEKGCIEIGLLTPPEQSDENC
jgi:hypothetical protein